ncbi:hypothetical protein DM860_000449 [Cuscuta australis]|nr:hypothetical protein DM860_000449 [Cuscuta australis]
MMQPGSMVPSPMPPMSADPSQQQQYQQPPQPWMLHPPQPPMQPQHPAAWAQQPPPMSHPMLAPYQTQPPQQYSGAYTGTSPAASSSPNEVKSLWIGDLQYWMDESYLSGCFSHTAEIASVKVIRNKFTAQPEGYGFIEFRSRAAAEAILQAYNGTLMPSTSDKYFRMNWATLGAGERRDNAPEHTIFVGDLSADVNDYLLQETFKAVYSSVKGAKVVTDKNTGCSKGYGFVKFADESEQLRALTEMNGVLCSTRPMRVGPANKQPVGAPQKATYLNPPASQGESDPNNTTIFVGGLDPNVTEELLGQFFSQHGEVVHIKIVSGKRCGFVQFSTRASAEQALSSLQGTQIGDHSIRLSWGRSPSNKQSSDQTKWGGSYYGYGQGYEAYGYAPPPQTQDPNMFYGSYPGYTANYQQLRQ